MPFARSIAFKCVHRFLRHRHCRVRPASGRTAWLRQAAWVAVLAAVVSAMSGCGGGVQGTYVAHPKGDESGKSGSLKLELKKGGVAVATITGPDGQSLLPVTGTYTVEGGKVITMLDNDRDEFALKDGDLSGDFFGEKIVFKKQ